MLEGGAGQGADTMFKFELNYGACSGWKTFRLNKFSRSS